VVCLWCLDPQRSMSPAVHRFRPPAFRSSSKGTMAFVRFPPVRGFAMTTYAVQRPEPAASLAAVLAEQVRVRVRDEGVDPR